MLNISIVAYCIFRNGRVILGLVGQQITTARQEECLTHPGKNSRSRGAHAPFSGEVMTPPSAFCPADLVPGAIIDVFEQHAPCSVNLGAMFPARVLNAWRAPVHVRLPAKDEWRGTSPAVIGGPVPDPALDDARNGTVTPHRGGLLITRSTPDPRPFHPRRS